MQNEKLSNPAKQFAVKFIYFDNQDIRLKNNFTVGQGTELNIEIPRNFSGLASLINNLNLGLQGDPAKGSRSVHGDQLEKIYRAFGWDLGETKAKYFLV